MEVNYVKLESKPKYPERMFYTLLFKKNDKLVAVGMINKFIKYIPVEIFEKKYKNNFIDLMKKYLDHCINNGKTSVEYDTIEESYTEIKNFNRNPYDADIYFVDVDAMEDYEENEYESVIRSIIHKYNPNFGDYEIRDIEAKDLGARKKYGSFLSNGYGTYTIKRKDELEWINSLFDKK